MKRFFVAAVVAVCLAGCSDEIDTSSRYVFTDKTITQYLQEKDYYSEYVRLLGKRPVSSYSETTLLQLLSARGHYTVFAPTNDAIQAYLDKYRSQPCKGGGGFSRDQCPVGQHAQAQSPHSNLLCQLEKRGMEQGLPACKINLPFIVMQLNILQIFVQKRHQIRIFHKSAIVFLIAMSAVKIAFIGQDNGSEDRILFPEEYCLYSESRKMQE